jgi:carbonic anhydrase
MTIPAAQALARLREGNQRFASHVGTSRVLRGSGQHEQLPQTQNPFAIILGCSDARVPAEIVFDQGLGDLFVIRVAGNIVAPSQVGSVEFAAEAFGTKLVVVLGHSECGAILATIDQPHRPAENRSRNLAAIVDRVRPSIEEVLSHENEMTAAELVRQSVRANIRASANHLRHGSDVLEEGIRERGLCVVGAEYNLATGLVDFFDGACA